MYHSQCPQAITINISGISMDKSSTVEDASKRTKVVIDDTV